MAITEETQAYTAKTKEERPQPWGGYTHFSYIGPSLPGGILKSNAILIGTFEEIKAFIAPALTRYPQAERLIFPLEKLSEQLKKVKLPGNLVNKYYNDLVSQADVK